jgi:hypothetical protein
MLKLNVETSERKLPSCTYLAIISPINHEGQVTSYAKAFETISFVRAFISLNFGKLGQYTWVADFDFNLEGHVTTSSETLRMPLFSDLMRIPGTDWSNEIAERLVVQGAAYRAKLQRGCDFIAHALNQQDEAFRFSAYWIALEVLVGKSGAIRDALAKAYGKNRAYVDEQLYFKEISTTRHNLMHFGKFGLLMSYQERLLQLYFWDIVRHQIGLPSRELAHLLVRSGLIEAERKNHTEQALPSPVTS